jgi:hypothetical protein
MKNDESNASFLLSFLRVKAKNQKLQIRKKKQRKGKNILDGLQKKSSRFMEKDPRGILSGEILPQFLELHSKSLRTRKLKLKKNKEKESHQN